MSATQSDVRPPTAEVDEQAQALDTPRTREACRRLGLTLEDLRMRPYSEFYIPGDFPAKQQLRFDHYEKGRRKRMKEAVAERTKVIMDEANLGEDPGAQNEKMLGLMESFLDKESKRLETDLKAQLRYHKAREVENKQQLAREARLQVMEETRQQRGVATKKQRIAGAEALREKREAAHGRNREVMGKIEADIEEKREKQAEVLQAEDERVKQTKADALKRNFDKSAKWRERVKHMNDTREQRVEERVNKAEEALAGLEGKIQTVTQNKAELQKKKDLESEKQQLQLLDVRSRKDRIARQEKWQYDQLRNQQVQNVERIDTLLALKDAFLNQRKDRATKAQADNGARAMSIRRECPVGPGRYEQHRDRSMKELPVTKMISDGINHTQFVEAWTKPTKNNPAPGTYDVATMPDGHRVDRSTDLDVILSKNAKTSFLDDVIREKSVVPGAGRYEVKDTRENLGTRMRRDCINDKGIDEFDPKQYRPWQRLAPSPGPAAYSVDGFTRKEALRRSNLSLPNLKREMLRAPSEDKKKSP